MPQAMPPVQLVGERDDAQVRQVLTTLRERFKRAAEYERDYRREAVEDLKFRGGEQWAQDEIQRRREAHRPYITINTLPQYERQITNEQRKSRPAITVLPVGNGANQETARVFKGVIRHINTQSHGDIARDTAFEAAVRHGRGYYRLCIDYEEELSFDQQICLARIRNPFMVYMDYSCQSPTYSDADWGILFEHMPREEFQAQWDVSASQLGFWASEGDSWIMAQDVRIAEYFYKDQQRVTLARLAGGQTELLEPLLLAPLKELENPQPLQRFVAHLLTPRPRYAPLLPWIRQQASTVDAWLDGLPGEFVAWYRAQVMGLVRQVVQVRPTTHTTMRWLKTNGHTILEESIWPGKWVPILPVLGDELDINNQVMLSGIIRHAKDPMRMKNYWTSMQAEHIALSPVPPWIAAVGQLEGHEDLWESANRKPYAYLPYNPLDVRGQPVPPPIRNAYEPPIQAITVAMQGSEHDTQATMGVYNASLGQTDSRQRSGVHAKILDQASDMGTYHYADNLSRTMKLEGEMLVDLIPKVLSPQRIQRIIGDDGTAQMVLLHPGGKDAYGQQPLPEGIAGVYDLTVGTYDVTIDVGPSYATRRQEASEQMLQLVQALPQAMQAVIYKVVGNMDWDGAAELADLLKQLPGQILEQGSGNDPKAQLAQLQAMLPQLQHQLQALNQYAQSVEQQAQQLAAENKDLKQAHDLKVLEMQLKAKEVQIKEDEAQVRAQAEVEKAALARQQAALEVRREMIEAHETRHETQGE